MSRIFKGNRECPEHGTWLVVLENWCGEFEGKRPTHICPTLVNQRYHFLTIEESYKNPVGETKIDNESNEEWDAQEPENVDFKVLGSGE